MSGRRASWAGWLFALAVALAAVAIGGALLVDLGGDTAVSSFLITNTAIGLSCAPCGFLIARAKPSNPVGWLFLGLGVAPLVTAAVVPLSQHGIEAGWSQGTMRVLIRIFTIGWPWGALSCLPLALQLFPDGRPLSPRWRWLA